MTPRIIRTACWAVAIACAIASPAAAQLEGNLGALTPENVKGYLAPLPSALSGTLTSSVFQGASIPVAGFNVSLGVHAMAVTFSDDDRTYNPSDPPWFQSTAPVDAPTVIGSTQTVSQPGQGGTSLAHPGGFDLSQFAVAVPQLQIGSVLGTRLVLRYITLDLGDAELGDLSLFGIGAQHSISRYFPGLPVNLAAGVFYQSFKIGEDDLIDTRAFQFGVTASKTFGFAEPYAMLGFDHFGMEVNYKNESIGTQDINVELDADNNVHFTGGVLLGFPVAKLFAEFNLAAQPGAALGLRVGI
jgi:hypothetical protein